MSNLHLHFPNFNAGIAQLTPTDVQKAADYASAQSDRWLFVALLIVGLLALSIVAKYFANQHALLAAKMDDSNKFQRETLMNQLSETTRVVSKNTEALEDIREVMARHRPPN